jgi:hypothetical protein
LIILIILGEEYKLWTSNPYYEWKFPLCSNGCFFPLELHVFSRNIFYTINTLVCTICIWVLKLSEHKVEYWKQYLNLDGILHFTVDSSIFIILHGTERNFEPVNSSKITDFLDIIHPLFFFKKKSFGDWALSPSSGENLLCWAQSTELIHSSRLVCGRCSDETSVRTLVILIDLAGRSQSLRGNSETLLQSRHKIFSPNPFQFVVHKPFYYFTLCKT